MLTKLLLALTLLTSPAFACETPKHSLLNMLRVGWPDLIFHFTDDEATLITRTFFDQPGGVDEVMALGSPARPQIWFIAIDKDCVVGRAPLTPEGVREILALMDKYQTYKRVHEWKTNP